MELATTSKSPAGGSSLEGSWGSWGWSWGCGVRLSVVALAPVWCGPRRELATPLKCQLGALKGFADAAEWHWIEN